MSRLFYGNGRIRFSGNGQQKHINVLEAHRRGAEFLRCLNVTQPMRVMPESFFDRGQSIQKGQKTELLSVLCSIRE